MSVKSRSVMLSGQCMFQWYMCQSISGVSISGIRWSIGIELITRTGNTNSQTVDKVLDYYTLSIIVVVIAITIIGIICYSNQSHQSLIPLTVHTGTCTSSRTHRNSDIRFIIVRTGEWLNNICSWHYYCLYSIYIIYYVQSVLVSGE